MNDRGNKMACHLVVLLAVLASQALAGENIIFSSSNAGKVGWYQRHHGEMSWSEIAGSAASPKEVCGAVARHVVYQGEAVDEWTGGKDTWKRGYGDCEDLAACIKELCEARGFEAETYIYVNKITQKAHAIVMGTWNGRTWIASNAEYYTVGAREGIMRKMAYLLNGWERDIASIPMSEFKKSDISNVAGPTTWSGDAPSGFSFSATASGRANPRSW